MLLGRGPDGPVVGRTVAITGIGVISSVGTGPDAFWDGLHGPAPEAERRVPDFDPEQWFTTKEARQYDRFAAGDIDEPPAKARAVDALRTLRYANAEYFFIDDFNGYSVLLPIRPELEGTFVGDLIDSQGRYFVRAQRDAAMAGGGIVRYAFNKPGTTGEAEKLAYVRPFLPWHWFVATGIYLCLSLLFSGLFAAIERFAFGAPAERGR